MSTITTHVVAVPIPLGFCSGWLGKTSTRVLLPFRSYLAVADAVPFTVDPIARRFRFVAGRWEAGECSACSACLYCLPVFSVCLSLLRGSIICKLDENRRKSGGENMEDNGDIMDK